ncbi:PXDN [Mytilus edulis]|uniref:PXDN n=1 Tax=Mytilus edulis TaxID=6550 RepID=A0A8S3TNX9_MYTED|nr:PXDN [Mytilus edulis]
MKPYSGQGIDIVSECVAEAVGLVDRRFQTSGIGQRRLGYDPVSIMSLFSRVKAAPVRVSSMARSADISEIASDIITRRMSITMGDLQGLGMSQRFATAIDSNCALKNIMCNPADIYRKPNGVCNNLKNPMWGSSITAQPRFIPPHYGDGKNIGIIPRYLSVSGEPLPNPRHISNSVHNGGISPPRGCQFTVLLTFFGQFVDHDVISTPTKEDREGMKR